MKTTCFLLTVLLVLASLAFVDARDRLTRGTLRGNLELGGEPVTTRDLKSSKSKDKSKGSKSKDKSSKSKDKSKGSKSKDKSKKSDKSKGSKSKDKSKGSKSKDKSSKSKDKSKGSKKSSDKAKKRTEAIMLGQTRTAAIAAYSRGRTAGFSF